MEFERRCHEIQHKRCSECKAVGLMLSVGRSGKCSDCVSHSDGHLLQSLPVWMDSVGEVRYDVPLELERLSIAEKMLIQLASVVIPLQHIKHGVFGLSGHCCSFEQDVEAFAHTLPRSRKETKFLQVVKDIRTEFGSDSVSSRCFEVSRSHVIEALLWLKKHNPLCEHVVIDERRLDWIDGESGLLEDDLGQCSGMKTQQDTLFDLNNDLGPCPKETMRQLKEKDSISDFGFLNEREGVALSPCDKDIQTGLRDAISKSSEKRHMSIAWPKTENAAISECGSKCIFAMAFPWLFPGGIGDVKHFPSKDMKKWGEMLLRFQDGRFQKDKFFCFYALNYITRHRNASSSNFFVRDFNKGGPETLEELQESIASGDTSFVNRITHMNQHVKGSTPFWHKKRGEIYAWINHHVQEGSGPPMFFITLSCAEHYWPDMLKVVKERMKIAGDSHEDCYLGSPKLGRILNEYSLVVQEQFQLRVEHWMDTVGKHTLGIKHHYAKYEFAPGRGQIHVHMLAISDNNSIYELCHQDLKKENGTELRAARMAEFAKRKFGLTATVTENFESLDMSVHPSSIRYSVSPPDTDGQALLKACQVHNCSGYCMRKGSNEHE